MFDRLIDLAIQIVMRLRCTAIVPQYEAGVVLRFGRLAREARPGLLWLWPVVEELHVCSTVPGTEVLPVQSLTTQDGRSLTVSCAVTWRVTDPAKHLLCVQSGSDAILDIVAGAIGSVIQASEVWAEPDKLSRQIARAANRRARPWGIRVDRVSFATFVTAPAYRLIQDRGSNAAVD